MVAESVSKSGLMLSNAGWSGWAPASTSRAKRLVKYLTTRREFLKSISKSMSKSFWNFNMYSKSKLKDERRYTKCGVLLLIFYLISLRESNLKFLRRAEIVAGASSFYSRSLMYALMCRKTRTITFRWFINLRMTNVPERRKSRTCRRT